MIPPATVSTLRTTEIVVSFITQSLLSNKSPQIIDTLGATFVILAAIAAIFETDIHNRLSRIFCNSAQPTSAHERLVEQTSEIADT